MANQHDISSISNQLGELKSGIKQTILTEFNGAIGPVVDKLNSLIQTNIKKGLDDTAVLRHKIQNDIL